MEGIVSERRIQPTALVRPEDSVDSWVESDTRRYHIRLMSVLDLQLGRFNVANNF
jgi:hypothetical protein